MRSSSLIDFLGGTLSATEFAREISGEVEAYRARHDRVGSTNPIELRGDHGSIQVDASGLIRLCDAVLRRELSVWDVHYVCDALGLSEASFESERVRDVVEELSNPELRREQPLDLAEIRMLRARVAD